MDNCHNTFLLSCMLFILLYHRPSGIFFWLNIVSDTPISISRYSYSLSLVITKQQVNDYSSKDTKNHQNCFLPYCIVWIQMYHIVFNIFLGEYWLRCAIFYFTLLRFGVFGDHKMVLNGYSSINMNNCQNIFLPYCILWISW